MALAIGLSPVVSKGVTLPTDVMDVTWLVLKELLVGGAFAFAVGGAVRRAEHRRARSSTPRSASPTAASSTR